MIQTARIIGTGFVTSSAMFKQWLLISLALLDTITVYYDRVILIGFVGILAYGIITREIDYESFGNYSSLIWNLIIYVIGFSIYYQFFAKPYLCDPIHSVSPHQYRLFLIDFTNTLSAYQSVGTNHVFLPFSDFFNPDICRFWTNSPRILEKVILSSPVLSRFSPSMNDWAIVGDENGNYIESVILIELFRYRNNLIELSTT